MDKWRLLSGRLILLAGLGMAIILGFISIILLFGNRVSRQEFAGRSQTDITKEVSRHSKYQITRQLINLATGIRELENRCGQRGPMRIRIYGAADTGRLFELYQAAQIRLDYLNRGPGAPKGGTRNWGGYHFQAGRNRPVQVAEITAALRFLEKYGWAHARADGRGNFLNGFRIFLLPYTIPDVSGLGGSGFNLLSALSVSEGQRDAALAPQIAVTLYHEIGHHLHLTMMPEETAAGRMLWEKYLRLRGASWHGPGKVNTRAWSDSSEETFAEDFRMLFGKDQPFYHDVTMGDPRDNPTRAALLRNYMSHLASRPVWNPYQSPWQPDRAAVLFWQAQPWFIGALWLFLGAGYWLALSCGTKTSVRGPAAGPAPVQA